ncbi:0328b81a-cd9f-4078-9cd4-59e2b251c493 [Thermothielavioides terrestris]|uniref:0328b81a-cd9f-4078-9cd4-59e2b251c493 n=1 Tax=Thermothielavioides terrestris TaxID=2587410 RepID=A0A3S4BJM0_9PEZI|nr:0328b81a-cd9f-4078-9cd4-59e2b251c493 [Thermothielavioides terrestris]
MLAFPSLNLPPLSSLTRPVLRPVDVRKLELHKATTASSEQMRLHPAPRNPLPPGANQGKLNAPLVVTVCTLTRLPERRRQVMERKTAGCEVLRSVCDYTVRSI